MKMIDVHLHVAKAKHRDREIVRKREREGEWPQLPCCTCVWGDHRASASASNRHKVKCREQLKAKWVNQVKVNCGTGNGKSATDRQQLQRKTTKNH